MPIGDQPNAGRSRRDSGRGARDYPPGDLIPGTVYKVKKVLGAGGMGTVYDVEDTTVGKRYVLKTLHPELGDRRDLARRMQQEARTLARLQHPNIVEVVTAGATTDDLKLPYYVMERLDGQNLRVIIDKMRRIDPGHAYHITVDLLDALDHAHEAGVIHRDVKPDNVFLHRSPAGTTVTKLLDFGIMRVLDGSNEGDTAGRFLGTLRYAAPEQLRGETLSARTDLYAAALVLYELITGRGPFDDQGDAQAIGRAHIKNEAPLISEFAPSIPSPVVHLIRRALSKDPNVRPRDAFTFAAELRGFLKGADAASANAARAAVATAATAATAVNVLGQVGTARSERTLGAAAAAGAEAPAASGGAGNLTERASSSHPPSSGPRASSGTNPYGDALPTAASAPPVTMNSGDMHDEAPLEAPAIDRRAPTRTSMGDALFAAPAWSAPPQNGTIDPAHEPRNATEAMAPLEPARSSRAPSSAILTGLPTAMDFDPYGATQASDPPPAPVSPPVPPSLPVHPYLSPGSLPAPSYGPPPPLYANAPYPSQAPHSPNAPNAYASLPPFLAPRSSTTASGGVVGHRFLPVIVAVGSAGAVVAIALGFYSLGRRQMPPAVTSAPATNVTPSKTVLSTPPATRSSALAPALPQP